MSEGHESSLSSWALHLVPDLESIPVNDVRKAVPSHRIVPDEVSLIHVPELLSADPGVFFAYGPYIF